MKRQTAGIFFEDEFGGECRAKAVTHPVAAGVHQIAGDSMVL